MATTPRERVKILGFEPPSQKEQERMAAEHVVDVKLRAHPTVKKIRNAIMDEVLRAGTKVSKRRLVLILSALVLAACATPSTAPTRKGDADICRERGAHPTVIGGVFHCLVRKLPRG